jgi:hypothetical protein
MRKLTSISGLAVAAGLALAAAPAQADAQGAPSDAIQPIVQGLPQTPALPPGLSPDVHIPPLPGNPTIPISPPYLSEIINPGG